ncbi:MAG: MbcA/ParS/Xre antitoxin family protein [Thermodesulfovibrionales bacterium]|nr:MbcA/ParS/Xre antitoxin family protein [Nitrospinota bacterium]MCG2778498.1 MbcA/ParS/Xre antitoxin family protein [Desulfobacterales bacterium]MDP3048926.1 MbcA/ParS/Xre antitoxin family protein [Thermodesulfovibrionales bacterium]
MDALASVITGGKVPSDLLSTEAGTEKVENLLIRIEYGVIS